MRRGGRLKILTLLAAIAWSTSASADPIRIGFDDVPTGETRWNYYDSSVGFTLISTVPNGGSGGNFIVSASAQASSAPNIAMPAGRLYPSIFLNTLQGRFRALNSPDPGLVDMVSFRVVGTQAGQAEPWTARIYDFGSTLLDTRQGTTDTLVSFTRPSADIGRLIFVQSARSIEGIDDVSFNPPVTPEPASLLLFGTGMVACAARLRKRRRK
jgi:hypothetical protein